MRRIATALPKEKKNNEIIMTFVGLGHKFDMGPPSVYYFVRGSNFHTSISYIASKCNHN